MKLKNIDEIKEDGLTVFMPSGIQATLFNEGENILVKYYNLHEDRYSVEDFKELISEGIEVFNDMPNNFPQIIESQEDVNLLNKLAQKGYIRESLVEDLKKNIHEELSIGTVFSDINGEVHTVDDIKYDGDIVIYLCDTDNDGVSTEIADSRVAEILQDGEYDSENYEETIWTTEYCIYLKDGTEEWFENKDSADAYFEEHKDEVDDYFSKEYDQYGNEGDVIIIYRASDLNESEESDEQEDNETKIEIEIKDDKVEIEGEIDGKEFEVEQPLETPAETEEEEEEEEEEEKTNDEEKPELSSFEAELADIQDGLIESVDELEKVELNLEDFSDEVANALKGMVQKSNKGLIITPDSFQNGVAGMNDDIMVKFYTELGLGNFEFMLNNKEYIIQLNGNTNLKEEYIKVERIDGVLCASLIDSDDEVIDSMTIGDDDEELSDDEIREYVRDYFDGDNDEYMYMNVERLDEADENGENTIESFFGLKETDFGSKSDLIKHIQEHTDYDVISSDNLTLNIKDRTNPNAEEIIINLKHEMKEWYQDDNFASQKGTYGCSLLKDKYNTIEELVNAVEEKTDFDVLDYDKFDMNVMNRNGNDNKVENIEIISEGYEQKDCKPGDVYTALKNKKKEYLTNDFKIELLGILDRLSKEFPDIAVRKQAREWMDELGLQEYYNTDKIVAFAKKYIKILDKHVVESMNEISNDTVRNASKKLSNAYITSGGMDKEAGDKAKKFNRALIKRNETKFGEKYWNNFKKGEKVIYFTDNEECIIEKIETKEPYPIITAKTDNRYINGFGWEFTPVIVNESLNEGMWESPFTVENAKKLAELLKTPVTFDELKEPHTTEIAKAYDEVLGDDKLWDEINSMAKEFPNDDARKCIADNLKVWMINKDNFDKDAYTQEGEQIIRAAIRDNLNESENPDYIVCKGQEISLDDNDYEWLDNDTFLFIIPADKKLIDEDGDEYYISCEWHEDEQKFIFEARYDDDFINLDKQNSYLTMNDKELIMAKMKKIISKINIKENLNETSNGIENIADALMQGAKKGFEPIEYGNWICTTSLDDKWESFSPVMKDYLLKEISYQVNTGDLEFEDLEISIDGDDCDKAMLDEDDIKALGMFDDEEIEEMINAEFKPLTFLISYNIEFDNKINEDLNMKKATKKALKKSKLKEEYGEYQGILDEVASDIERYNNSNDGSFEAEGFSYEWGPLTINGETWEELGLENEQAKEWIRHEIAMPVKDGHDYYRDLDCILVLGESELKDYYLDEECAAKEEFIADMVKLGCDEETLRDAIEYIKKNGDKDRSDCKEVEWWIDYDINLVEVENEDDEDEEDEEDDLPEEEVEEFCVVLKDGREEWFDGQDTADNYFEDHKADVRQYYRKVYKVKGGDVVEDSSSDEVIYQDLDEQFKVKDKKKKKKKIDDNLDKKVGNMKKLTEDAYKVYNTIENRECGTFNSWNDVENFLNQEWGSYSADKAKENPNFGSEEDKANFFGNYSMDVVQLPVAVEPETNCDICDCEPDTCGGCADIEVPDDAEVIEIPAEVAAENPVEIDVEVAPLDLDAFINTLVDEPEVEEPQTDDTEETCADCGCNPCECTTVIASDIIEESKKPLKEDEGIDAFDDEDKEYEFRTVRKNAMANPNAYEGRYTQSDIRVARKAYADDIEAAKAQEQAKNDLAKTEEFKDNMGMLTDINDTDFPDALKQAVDTKEDGSLYRISDIAKELEELKASFKQEIESIKQDIKTTLTDIKQDIKSDVKDIQTDVTSKLDNTNSKIADLTSEEGLDDEELDLENEAPVDTEEELDLENEPAEEETTEETDEDELTEAEKRAFVQNYVKQNGAIYEQIKNVIRSSKLEGKKMSVPTIAEKLREDYGLDTRAGVVYDNVSMICEYTPVSKYIIDPDTEKALMKTQSLGLANRFIKSGLQDVWANNKQQENLSNLDTVLSSKAENLDQAKKAIDKFANQDGNAEKIKKAIELTTDNDQEKEQALDYAIDKIDESYSTDSVMSKLLNARGTLGNITAVQGIGFKSIPKK